MMEMGVRRIVRRMSSDSLRRLLELSLTDTKSVAVECHAI